MDSSNAREYNIIKVTGPVSVERVDLVQRPYISILIMGPTGSGKSTFVEALGYKNAKRISSNQLEGFTQRVSTYRLNNVSYFGCSIYLVDSPGFADTKISELSIVTMIQKWRKDNGNGDKFFDRILFFSPVTHVRLPGTQRRVLKTFGALTGAGTEISVSLVTTMWDSIWTEEAMKRAEMTFNQLQNEIWKNVIQNGAQISKFLNTQESALSILDSALSSSSSGTFNMENIDVPLRDTLFAINLYTDLQERILTLESAIATIRAELADVEEESDPELLSDLLSRLKEAEKYLALFQKQLRDFGPPPAPSQQTSHSQPSQGWVARATNLIIGYACCGRTEANQDT